MNRVVIECKGRLANNILCWANAVHVLAQLGIKDREIVIMYPELDRLVFPPGTVVDMVDVSKLPRVTRNEIAMRLPGDNPDCLWVWEDVYANFPDIYVMKRIIQMLRFPTDFGPPFAPIVGVHIRFGDYETIDHNNPPNPMPPFPRAKNSYYLTAMAHCDLARPGCSFFVASDATKGELQFLNHPRAIFGNRLDPLRDLFTLSRCKLIIGSESTFSHVASYLGNVPIVLPSTTDAAAVIRATL